MIVKLKLFAVGVAADKSILQRNIAILEVLKENDKQLYEDIASRLSISGSKFFNVGKQSGLCAFEKLSLEEYLVNVSGNNALAAKLVKFISTPSNKSQIENYPVVKNLNNSCFWDLGCRAARNNAMDAFTDEMAEKEIQKLEECKEELKKSLSSYGDELKRIVSEKWKELDEEATKETLEFRDSVLEYLDRYDKDLKQDFDQVWRNSKKKAHNQNYMNLWFEINKIVEKYTEENSEKKAEIEKKLAEIDKKLASICESRSKKLDSWIKSPEFKNLVEKQLTRIEDAMERDLGSSNIVKGTAKKFAMESVKRFIKEHPWKVGIASAGLAALTAFGIYKGVKNNNKPAEDKVDSNKFNSYKDMFNNR